MQGQQPFRPCSISRPFLQVTEGLTRDLNELAADRRCLQRDLEIKSEVEQQMAIRGALQVGAYDSGLILIKLLQEHRQWATLEISSSLCRLVLNVADAVGSEPERRHRAYGISRRQHSSNIVIL